jgi:hypothetical protein
VRSNCKQNKKQGFGKDLVWLGISLLISVSTEDEEEISDVLREEEAVRSRTRKSDREEIGVGDWKLSGSWWLVVGGYRLEWGHGAGVEIGCGKLRKLAVYRYHDL